jgi:hypothetical protein
LGGSGAWDAGRIGAPAPFVLAKLRVSKGRRVNQNQDNCGFSDRIIERLAKFGQNVPVFPQMRWGLWPAC